MSDSPQTYSSISASLNTIFRDEVEKTANRRLGILRFIPIVKGEGKGVYWDVESTGAVVETFSDADDVSNTGSDALQAASLAWGLRRTNFRIGTHAIRVAKSSRGPRGLNDLLIRNSINAAAALASQLNADIYTTTSGSLTGVDTAVAATGTYATLNHATAFWQSTVSDPGSNTALTIAQVRSDLATIFKNSGERPDMGWVNPDVYNVMKALFDSSRREVRSLTTARGPVALDNSVEVIVIDGCTFMEDKDAVNNQIEYMNSNYIELHVLPVDNRVGVEVPANDGFGNLLMGFELRELGSKGASRIFTMEANVQLAVRNPRKFGRRLHVGT